MAVDRRLGLLALIFTPLLISGRFLRNEPISPTKDGHRFKDGDLIPLFASKLFSRVDPSDKGYPYFDLPFCPPGEPINNRKKSITEIISGDCFTNTQYEIRFNVSTFDNLLCEKTLTRAEVAKFRDAIKAGFGYEMSFNDWFMRGMVGEVGYSYETGPRYYLFTYLRFKPLNIGKQVKRISVSNNYDSKVDITEDVEIKVKFTYSVFWEEHLLNEDYDLFPRQSLKSMLSLIFWPTTVFFLFGLLLLLLLGSYFTRYFIRYLYGAGFHGDTCNCPPYSSLLGAFLGTGTQILFTACILFYMSYSRRTLYLDDIVRAFCLTFVLSGYKAVAFHLRFARLGWIECIFLAGTLYYIPTCLMVFSVNIIAKLHSGESGVDEVGKSFKLLMAYGILNIALSIFGGMIAYFRKGMSDAPCSTRTTTPRREIIPQCWYRRTLAHMILGGLPPFIYISPLMDSTYAGLLNLTVCGAFYTMFTSFVLIIGWTVVIEIGFGRLIDLSRNDYRWWWRSVLRGGSNAIYMFFYIIYFASKTHMKVPVLIAYLGYNVAVFYALFLILGSISFYVSLINHHGYDKDE